MPIYIDCPFIDNAISTLSLIDADADADADAPRVTHVGAHHRPSVGHFFLVFVPIGPKMHF